jgi:leucyl aminopeptidase
MHVLMKMDMTGAAVVLATLSLLPVLRPKVKVIGYLCCTDNMPSGSAMKLGDVLTC